MLIATSVQTIFGEKFVLKTSVDSPAVLLLLLVSEKRKNISGSDCSAKRQTPTSFHNFIFRTILEEI